MMFRVDMGVGSTPVSACRHPAATLGGTAIVFADVEQNERSEDVKEIPMEVGTTQPE